MGLMLMMSGGPVSTVMGWIASTRTLTRSAPADKHNGSRVHLAPDDDRHVQLGRKRRLYFHGSLWIQNALCKDRGLLVKPSQVGPPDVIVVKGEDALRPHACL